jgi:glycosyltransferase involved in cell wall biosynthesis
MSGRPLRVAHLVSHPIQYFAPLYRELASRREIDVTVFFYSDATAREFIDPGFGRSVTWDTPLLDGYRYRFMASASRTDLSSRVLKRPNWDIVREIASGRYDVLWVHGYAHLTTWLAGAAARGRGMRVLIRDEQTLLHTRPLYKRLLKSVALRALYSQASALYIGEQNRRYFRHYGMSDARMFAAPYCVDNAYFQARADELAPRRDEIRARFGITDGAPVVLFSGKLIAKKQPLLLIEAFARVHRERGCHLLIAGDGPLRATAEQVVARLGVADVHFAGFLNQGEISDAYAAADVFVLPSMLHETWGLVVNEAMNFGLPVVVSDKVGCGVDLVREGRNGFVVPHDSVERLAAAIDALVAAPAMRARFGDESRRIIDGYSIERAADGIVAGCVGMAVLDPTGDQDERLAA